MRQEELKKALQKSKQKLTENQLDLGGLEIGKFTKEQQSIINQYKSIQVLILTQCKLNSLQNLPSCNLSAIDLSQNQISDSELHHLKQYKNLNQLLLNDNQIQKLESLEVFKGSKITELDLSGNSVVDKPGYRNALFKMMPKLESLDGMDKDGNPIEEDVEEDEDDFEASEEDEDEDDQYDEDEDSQSNQAPRKKKK